MKTATMTTVLTATAWLALLLAGCGKKDEGTPGTPSGAKGGGIALVGNRTAPPWPAAPPAGIREAMSWVTDVPDGEATILDPVAVREHYADWRRRSAFSAARKVRQLVVRDLGLPEDACRLAIVLLAMDGGNYGEVLVAAKLGVGLEAVRAAARSVGLEEVEQGGRPAWRRVEPDQLVAAWDEGWIVQPTYQHRVEGGGVAQTLEKALAARAGNGSLLGKHPRLPEALAGTLPGAPGDAPVEVTWGKAVHVPSEKADPPLVTVESERSSRDEGAIVLLFADDAKRAVAQAELTAAIAAKKYPMPPDAFLVLEERGSMFRMYAGGTEKRDLSRAASEELSALVRAVLDFRAETMRLPTDEEGLAILSTKPRLLDEFLGLVPKDPWGRPYHYRASKPQTPEAPDLRSAGPDGEIDTEDDVFPESN